MNLLLLLTLSIFTHALGRCETKPFNGATYEMCTYTNKNLPFKMFWKKPDGTAYGSFAVLNKELAKRHEKILFATNAGPYQSDLSPVGLYIEDGKELLPIKKPSDPGDGNLFIRPNGVTYIDHGTVGVLTTEEYMAAGLKPEYANQSGPMLTLNGEISKRLDAHSTSLKTRDGVCLIPPDKVVFSITQNLVSLHTYAAFLQSIGCKNGLSLDTTVSSFFSPELKRNDVFIPIGPMIALIGH